jgi:hypothetical protein
MAGYQNELISQLGASTTTIVKENRLKDEMITNMNILLKELVTTTNRSNGENQNTFEQILTKPETNYRENFDNLTEIINNSSSQELIKMKHRSDKDHGDNNQRNLGIEE